MKTLLFDLDGTLADPLKAFKSCVYFAFDQLQILRPLESSLRPCIGPPLEDSFLGLLGESNKNRLQELIYFYREHHKKIGIYQYEFYPYIDEALQGLQNKYQLFVVTSKPWIFAKPLLKHFSKEKYFNKIYGSEVSGERAKKTELIKFVLTQESLNAHETIMIGDRLHDIEGAKENGVYSIGVTWGYGSYSELKNAGADQIFSKISELNKIENYITPKIRF